ncbi:MULTISPECIES: lytic transglycosylase domain-containing protein [unclassified Guyparkeria]|uniref:lytic transglycosylase domain-containing protein n=1 Tax=unclassified Guyparkeria TaxID=2626246 RepID=UPI0012E3C643|nr:MULTISPECIES: lytic transglycosylase domain-containing protein [unclassified Guyparkeria]
MTAVLSPSISRLIRLPLPAIAVVALVGLVIGGSARAGYIQGEPPAVLAEGLAAIERHDRAGFRRALDHVDAAEHGEAIRLYLETRWLIERVDEEPAAVAARLREHPEAPLTPRLKRRYLDHLAEQEAWGQFRLVFDRPPEITPGTRRQCAYWQAELALDGTLTGEQAEAALTVWQRGRSQPDACDPIFAWLDTNEYLDASAYRARIRAAVTAGQDGLARYLVRRGPTGLGVYRDRWQALRDRPVTAVAERIEAEGDSEAITQGLLWLAKKDPARARELLKRATRLELLDETQAGRVSRLAALKAAYLYQPQAFDWLREVPVTARDHEVWTWTVRSALRHLDWARVKQAIDAMPEEIGSEREWRFWRAEAEQRLGRTSAARTAWRKLAETPDYHGFLAADRLGVRYPLPDEPVAPPEPNAETIAAFEARPWLALAFALHRLDRPEDARRLFGHALDDVAEDRLPALAWLADQAGWADRASVVLARMQAFHEPEWLATRYATPYRSLVEAQAERQSIPPAWVYSVMRRESLFMRDIGSGVGASGLMQLMPATGRWINRQAGLGLAPLRLTDPGTNIALGAAYLAHMAERFDNRYPLAIAAYNAGPGRARDWLPDVPLPGDVWVDTILFDETRAYAQAVLAGMVIYHWRLTGSPQRLGTLLPVIPSAD